MFWARAVDLPPIVSSQGSIASLQKSVSLDYIGEPSCSFHCTLPAPFCLFGPCSTLNCSLDVDQALHAKFFIRKS
jgi:hypothetical protein